MSVVLHDWLHLVCPTCRGELNAVSSDRLTCPRCGNDFEVIHGIPDLRVSADPFISRVGDVTKSRFLFDQFSRRDLAGLVHLYYDVTPEVPEKDVKINLSRVLGGVGRARAALASWEQDFGPIDGATRMLDVGCGTAPLVAAVNGRVPHVTGVDIGFRHITIGLKRLEEEGSPAPLIGACAEALPFPDASFDLVTMQHSLESMDDPDAGLSEAWRVLAPGGRLLVSTPNAFSLGPDPHIGVFGGSWFPDRLVSVIARLQMARPPRRKLQSAGGLARRLSRAGFTGVRVGIPGLSASQIAQFSGVAQGLAATYERVRGRVPFRQVLRFIGPLLQAEARRP
jgi:SAM-dependent methyltransferase